MKSWILTAKGNQFDFEKPDEFFYDIEDIAHGLSHINRFTGATRVPYSVAEHCIHVSNLVPLEYALEGLLHDAGEAFMGDVSTPLKKLLPEYKAIEYKVEMAIAKQFGLEFPFPSCIKNADYRMLVTEKRDLLVSSPEWEDFKEYVPLKERIWPMKNREAREAFLKRYYSLVEQR